MTCECKGCVESKHFFGIIAKLGDEDKKWMENLYEQIDHERLDANVNECIIDGTWPSADQQIAHKRARVVVFDYPKEK